MTLKFFIFFAIIISSIYYTSCNNANKKTTDLKITKEDTIYKIPAKIIDEAPLFSSMGHPKNISQPHSIALFAAHPFQVTEI